MKRFRTSFEYILWIPHQNRS